MFPGIPVVPAEAVVWMIARLVWIVGAIVLVVGVAVLLVLFVRFLLVATRAAQIYVSEHTPPATITTPTAADPVAPEPTGARTPPRTRPPTAPASRTRAPKQPPSS